MAAEDFFTRWSKKKDAASASSDADAALGSETAALTEPHAVEGSSTVEEPVIKPLPSLEDVDMLTHDSDYSAFMAQGVDETVKRSAMKKLFSNPHFNIMDGLDIYIDDYSKFTPISPALLASLSHAKALLDPLSQLQAPLMTLLDTPKKIVQTETDGEPIAPELIDESAIVEEVVPVVESAESEVEAERIPAEPQEAQEHPEPQEYQESDSLTESGVTHNAKDI